GESVGVLGREALDVGARRVRPFRCLGEVMHLAARHDHVFVVEQNRDGQLRTLLVAEGMLPSERLTPVLHYDGTPITARFIHGEISQRLKAFNVTPLKRTAATGE